MPVPAGRPVIRASRPRPRQPREAVTASADGFALTDAAPDKITEAIRRVAAHTKAG